MTEPEEREERVISLAAQGLSQHQIGRLVGLSQPGVRKVLVRCGVLIPKGQRDNQPQRSHEQDEHVETVLAAADNLAGAGTELAGGMEAVSAVAALLSNEAQRASTVPEQPWQEASLPLGVDMDMPLRVIQATGMASCGWCHDPFRPRVHQSRFCCSSCGAKANGMVPVHTHAPDCRRRCNTSLMNCCRSYRLTARLGGKSAIRSLFRRVKKEVKENHPASPRKPSTQRVLDNSRRVGKIELIKG